MTLKDLGRLAASCTLAAAIGAGLAWLLGAWAACSAQMC